MSIDDKLLPDSFKWYDRKPNGPDYIDPTSVKWDSVMEK